jgi:hypothetical protein
MTVLALGNIKLDYIVDDNPLKLGKYTAIGNVPVVAGKYLQEDKRRLLIVYLAWNFATEISGKIQSLREGNTEDVQIVKYFPAPVLG